MTAIRYLIVLALIAGCGKDIEIKNNKLKSLAPLTDKDEASFQKSGTFIKGSTNQLQYQGKTYTVSVYSSKTSQDFAASIASGSQVNVYFTGGISGDQVVLETIKRR